MSASVARSAERAPIDVGTFLRRAAVTSAIIVGLVPERWLHIHPDVRWVWATELFGFAATGIAAVLSAHKTGDINPTGDNRQRSWTATWCAAVILWLLAPLGGIWGLLLRLPILQIAFLASRSPAKRRPLYPDR